jgi:serine/threonine-protein kinase
VSDVAISPDGRWIAYVAEQDSTRQLFLRKIDQFAVTPIQGTEGAYSPFFSPDSQWICFFADAKLKKVSLLGGKPTPLCDTQSPTGGGTWGPEDVIIFGSVGLKQVSAKGGKPEAITTLDSGRGEYSHVEPEFLPDGRAVLFTIYDGSVNALYIMVKDLETNKQFPIIEGGRSAHFVPSGHLVYAQGGSLLAAPFDLKKLEITGPSVAVLEGLKMIPFSFSKNGSLVYVEGSERSRERMLVWVDRQGKARPVTEIRRRFVGPRISPDGRRLAMWVEEKQSIHVWIYDFAHDTMTPLTSEGRNFTCLWTPDGKRVTFNSSRPGVAGVNLFWKLADGSGPKELLFQSQYNKAPLSWTPDGKVLLFHQRSDPPLGFDIWKLPIEGDRKPVPLLDSPSNERWPAISPDGQWLAYVSDKSGRNEVYVTPFPGPGGHRQISTQGGRDPAWAHDGRELFYRNGEKMMAVDIVTEPEFTPANPRMLFEGKYLFGGFARSYDITPDDQQFVMVKASEQESPPTQINVVLNWFEELKRLVPTEKQ